MSLEEYMDFVDETGITPLVGVIIITIQIGCLRKKVLPRQKDRQNMLSIQEDTRVHSFILEMRIESLTIQRGNILKNFERKNNF